MLKRLIECCNSTPQLGAYLLFDEYGAVYVSAADGSNQLHETFVAVQQLGQMIGSEFGAEALMAGVFRGSHEQFYLTTLRIESSVVFAVFRAAPEVDLEALIGQIWLDAQAAVPADQPAENAAPKPDEEWKQPRYGFYRGVRYRLD